MLELVVVAVSIVVVVVGSRMMYMMYIMGYKKGVKESLGIPLSVRDLPCQIAFRFVGRIGSSNLIILRCSKLWGLENRVVDTEWLTFPDGCNCFYLVYSDTGSLVALKGDIPETELKEETASPQW